MHASHDVVQAQQGGWGPPPGGGGYGPPPGGGGFGGPPPGGGGFGGPPPGGGGFGGPPPGGFGGPPGGGYGGPPGGAPFGAPPPGGGFGAPPGGGFGPGGPPPPDLEGQLGTWFILSIVSIFLGCCLGGIISTVMMNGAKQAFAAGNYMEAQSKLGTAKIITIISFVIGALGLIGNIAANL